MTMPVPDQEAAPRRVVDVVGAVVVRDGFVLCARRGPGAQAGLWEFPGGKVEPGECAEQALAREIVEELDCAVRVLAKITTTRHDYETLTVNLTTYWATIEFGEPIAREHTDLAWVAPSHLRTLPWAPADVSAVEMVAATLAG